MELSFHKYVAEGLVPPDSVNVVPLQAIVSIVLLVLFATKLTLVESVETHPWAEVMATLYVPEVTTCMELVVELLLHLKVLPEGMLVGFMVKLPLPQIVVSLGMVKVGAAKIVRFRE